MVSRRNRVGGSSPPRTSLRPVVLAAAVAYLLQKHFNHLLLPWGPAVSQIPPRMPHKGDHWHAPIDRTNDSLRFHHGRTYKIFDANADSSVIHGPETVLVHPIDQSVYVMTDNGQLVQLSNLPNPKQEQELLKTKNYDYKADTIIVQADLGPGRPLGGSFTPNGKTLYMADAALGLTRLQAFKNPKSRVELVASQVPVLNENGEQHVSPILYANAVAIGPKTGRVYFSDSSDIPPDRLLQAGKKSSRKYRWDTMYASKMELSRGKPSGRLCEYNPKTGQVRVLQDQIHFCNGIGIDKDEQFLVVSETFGTNVLKFNLNADDGLLKPSQYLEPTVLVPSHEFTGYIDNLHCGFDDSQKKTMCYGAILTGHVKMHKLWAKLPAAASQALRTFLLMVPRTWAPKVVPTYTGVLVVDPSQPYDAEKKNFYYIQDPSGEDVVLVAGVTVSPDHSKLYLGSLTNDHVGVYLLKDNKNTKDASDKDKNERTQKSSTEEAVA
jgi:sugar lactone lactonase YvrE